MVVAVRCPAAACRKYMLVEAADRGKVVPCLICRRGIPVPGDDVPPPLPPALPPTAAAPVVLEAESLEPIFDPPPVPGNDDDLLGLT